MPPSHPPIHVRPRAPWPILCIGWVDVGWRRRCNTCRSLHELDHQGTVFLFFAVDHSWGSSYIICAGWRTFTPHKEEWLYHLVFMVRHTRGSCMLLPVLSVEVAIPEMKSTHESCHPYSSPPHKRFLVGCSSPFMRLAEHLTALRAWCKQCLLGR